MLSLLRVRTGGGSAAASRRVKLPATREPFEPNPDPLLPQSSLLPPQKVSVLGRLVRGMRLDQADNRYRLFVSVCQARPSALSASPRARVSSRSLPPQHISTLSDLSYPHDAPSRTPSSSSPQRSTSSGRSPQGRTVGRRFGRLGPSRPEPPARRQARGRVWCALSPPPFTTGLAD